MRRATQVYVKEVINSDVEPAPLRANPTAAQIRQHADERTKRHKTMSCIQNCVSDVIFTRIMARETPKQAWDKLKEEFQGTERTRQQQLLNLRRDFKNLKMKEEETVKQYSDRIMAVVNSIRLLGEQFNEARRASRMKEHQEGAFQAKTKSFSSTSAYKGKETWKNRPKPDATRRGDQPCRHCKKPGHSKANCWFRPDAQYQLSEDSSDHEEQVFAVSCSPDQKKASKWWLLDSGCTNHMSPNEIIFKKLDRSCKTKVKVGNGQFIKAKGKGDVLICTSTGNKLISNVLLVPEIDRNLLSIAQLLEKGYSMVFKGKECQITDLNGSRLMSVRLPFPLNQAWRALERLQLVHTDVCGPMKTQSLNDSRYFILFVDDYSRYCWIFFLKHKSEVAQVFLKFKTAIEIETSCRLKTIRLDNGTEYTSAQFQAYCDDAGIKHQLTNVYTPQQNGVNERKNRSLMDIAKLPTKALDHKTPYEAWFRFKPSLAHLKVFGCLCYVHVPAMKRDKLSKKTQPRILVGYSFVKKCYKILDPSTNKIQVSRDVIFNEKTCWNWDRNEPETASEELIADQIKDEQDSPEMDIADVPIRGTRPLTEIYERLHVAIVEPDSLEEAEAHEGWKQAMIDEIMMIEKNQAWELTAKPANKRTIGVKWIYRAKHNADESLNKLKARLVVKGFSQRYGLDYMETFAPVAKLDIIRLLVALAAQKQWSIHQLGVRSAFLNGFLEEEIYIDQPQRFVVSGKEHMVYRLKKALYGLKQAPRAWYARIDSYLGFNRSIS
ncbi:Retrovirus-related Pol polyprotein from transposon TNT 1-94 [Gossypium australe]|uniref:Retrovirus-related Pol polyprotein from transposon TNT 1-94 n=1 Tax=Gossypium australe TaxID=47621 RepID=A0A5B6U7W3_9ROSI|nr:Retrovirus-related Pol polyprotein from transposon TNT 1-94 [Gossypium australe]